MYFGANIVAIHHPADIFDSVDDLQLTLVVIYEIPRHR